LPITSRGLRQKFFLSFGEMIMVRSLRRSIVIAALVAGTATAAEIPAAAPAPAATYNWTGFYIGANAGGFWTTGDNSLSVVNDPVNNYFFPPAIPEVDAAGSPTLNSRGLTGGGQIGYNLQLGSAVAGLEADFNALHWRKSRGGTFVYTTNGAPYTLTQNASTDWLATVRPRLAWKMDRGLLYATAGLALTQLHFKQHFTEAPFTPTAETASLSKTKAGWTIGGGYEHAFADNWSFKVEYLFARFSGDKVVGRLANANGSSTVPGFVDGATFNNSLSSRNFHIARIGINFRFSSLFSQ
jgi:outer membrane immunogenic protein